MRLSFLSVLARLVVASTNFALEQLDRVLGTQSESLEVVGEILESVESLDEVPGSCFKSRDPQVVKLILSKCHLYFDSNQRVLDIAKVISKKFYHLQIEYNNGPRPEYEIIRVCLEELSRSDWNILKMYAHSPSDLRGLNLLELKEMFPEPCKKFITNAIERVVVQAENGWDISQYARQIEFLTGFEEFTPCYFKRLLDGPLPLEYPSSIYISWLDFTLSQRRPDLAFVAYHKGIKQWQLSRTVWPCHEEDTLALINIIAIDRTWKIARSLQVSLKDSEFRVLPKEVLSSNIVPLLYRLVLKENEEEFYGNLMDDANR